ncbi:MAG: ribosome biogenesis GTPase Der [Verrucomicrobia bacterium]|nr:ribosome biogenesis GTPase Der [Verrucomicrobiota bacterium]MCH8512781.1 ribosome biogenesis GTPase Der [Kiritimatiellia bacterium]
MENTAIKARNRTVAIVGRPNVGKSSLFNRLAGQRIAIVHEESGITRDRLSAEVKVRDERFELIDTGGIGYIDRKAAKDTIEAGILDQVKAAIEDAGLILFVVDTMAGVLPLDQEVAMLLREAGRPVFLVANKSDNITLDAQAVEFEQFSFPVYPLSTLHNRGVGDLTHEILGLLPEDENFTVTDPLKIAVVGRPNAGKSSFINRLIKVDRVIVSEIAGTTRDSIEVPFQVGHGDSARHYKLIDTAGLRKWGKVKEAVDKYSNLRTERSIQVADITILVLDASEGPKVRDKKILSLIEKAEAGCIVLVNKWDLAENITTQRQYEEALRRELPYLDHVPIFFGSALGGYNMRKMVEAIDEVSRSVSTTLTTGVLNRVLRQAFERTSPHMVKGRRLKMYYATQVGTRPIRIKIFVNSPSLVPEPYEKYLKRCLRETFGLDGAPLVLIFNRRRALEERD